MPESALAPFRVCEGLNRVPINSSVGGDNHLGDTITPFDNKTILAEIRQNHSDFPPIIRIDSPGRIQYTDAVLNCQTAPRPHLGLGIYRQLDRDSCFYQSMFTWPDFNTLTGKKIKAGISWLKAATSWAKPCSR